MAFLASKKYRIIAFFTFVFILVVSFFVLFLNQPRIQIPSHTEQKKSESFTFFSVGENTILTKLKLKELKKILGQHRLENITPISIDFVEKGWLPQQFPELKNDYDFFNNSLLIKPITSRTLKLSYRYAEHHSLPFENIQFIFSDYSKKPLFLELRLPGDGKDILNKLFESYGKPQGIENKLFLAPSFFWKDRYGLLIAAVLADRYGNPETHILIVYTENINVFIKKIMTDYPEPDIKTGF